MGELRNLGVTAKLVIKSANDSAADVARFKRAGADDVISKGLTVEALGRELVRILRNGPNDAAARFDSTVLAHQGEAMRHLMIQSFRQMAPMAVVAANAACRDGRAEAVRSHVHRLKGQALCVGATELVQASEAMRYIPVEEYPEALVGLRAALDAALATLANIPGVTQDVADAQTQLALGTAGHCSSNRPLLNHAHAATHCASVLIDIDASIRELLNELRASVAVPSAPCRQLLHRLRGACMLIGAERLAHCAAEGKESDNAFSDDALAALEALHAETLTELEPLMHDDDATAPDGKTVVSGRTEPLTSPGSTAAGSISGKEAVLSHLVCVGLDDHNLFRSMQANIFAELGADVAIVLGGTREEQLALVGVALGQLNCQRQPVPPPQQRAADLVILDQNVAVDVIGSALAVELRERGFRGVICIVSGDSDESLVSLNALPAVDLACGKDTMLSAGFIHELHKLLDARGGRGGDRSSPEHANGDEDGKRDVSRDSGSGGGSGRGNHAQGSGARGGYRVSGQDHDDPGGSRADSVSRREGFEGGQRGAGGSRNDVAEVLSAVVHCSSTDDGTESRVSGLARLNAPRELHLPAQLTLIFFDLLRRAPTEPVCFHHLVGTAMAFGVCEVARLARIAAQSPTLDSMESLRCAVLAASDRLEAVDYDRRHVELVRQWTYTPPPTASVASIPVLPSVAGSCAICQDEGSAPLLTLPCCSARFHVQCLVETACDGKCPCCQAPVRAMHAGREQAIVEVVPAAPRMLGLADTLLWRQLHTHAFIQLGADMAHSVSLGATATEQAAFVDVALGRLDVHLRPVPLSMQQPIDIVLLDSSINLGGRKLGAAHLISLLRVTGYTNLICVFTGMSSRLRYRMRTNPQTDLVLAKGLAPEELGMRVRLALATQRMVPRSPTWAPALPTFDDLLTPRVEPSGLICIGITGNAVTRRMLEVCFADRLGARPGVMSEESAQGGSSRVLDAHEAHQLVPLALGSLNVFLFPAVASMTRAADIVVIDADGAEELAAKLCADGFEGTISVLSTGVVHAAPGEMADHLLRALLDRRAATAKTQARLTHVTRMLMSKAHTHT